MAVRVTAPKIDFLWSLSWVALCAACLPITFFPCPGTLSLWWQTALSGQKEEIPLIVLLLQGSISCRLRRGQAALAAASWGDGQQEGFTPRFPVQSQYDPSPRKLGSSAMVLSTWGMSRRCCLCSCSSRFHLCSAKAWKDTVAFLIP